MPDPHPELLPPVFEALIVPHRSLTRKGVAVLMTLLSVLVALIIVRFWTIGAWPVAAFSLIEVPLVALLLQLNFRGGRASEMILLNQDSVTVTRADERGRRSSFSMQAAWLRVDYESDSRGSRILLRSHGRTQEVGAFLHEPDKQSLAEALHDALDGLRNPRFDNPQLRPQAESVTAPPDPST